MVVLSLCIFVVLRDSVFISIPFVSTRRRAIKSIVSALCLSEWSVLYDLGCGNGSVLKEAIEKTPGAKGIGVEMGYLPYFLSSINTRNLPIIINWEDLFLTDISEATHIYCYLSKPAMEKLSKKFISECKKGVRIVSCDSCLSGMKQVQTIPLAAEGDKLSRTLYVYEIR